jgi:hypothetical protein
MSTCGRVFTPFSACAVKIGERTNCATVLMLSRSTSRDLWLRRVCSSDAVLAGAPACTRDSKSHSFSCCDRKNCLDVGSASNFA